MEQTPLAAGSINEALLAAVARYCSEGLDAPLPAEVAIACDIDVSYIRAALLDCDWVEFAEPGIDGPVTMTPDGRIQAVKNGWLDEEPEAARSSWKSYEF